MDLLIKNSTGMKVKFVYIYYLDCQVFGCRYICIYIQHLTQGVFSNVKDLEIEENITLD